MGLPKIFGLCLMRKVGPQLISSDNQFWLKRKYGADLCIFNVKSVIKYYNLHNSPVCAFSLDASKVYDRGNHWILFGKLLNRSNHILIVRMLMLQFGTLRGYSTQTHFLFFIEILFTICIKICVHLVN